jgi:hypothetical protein
VRSAYAAKISGATKRKMRAGSKSAERLRARSITGWIAVIS